MKNLAVIMCAAALLSLPAVAMTADGQTGAPGKGKVVAETVVAKQATVKAIDQAKRIVTLQMPDGREETLVVDKAVKKLGQVKVGDKVNVRYREAISVKINKTKVAPGVKVEETLTPEEKSVKPAGTAALRMTAIATIERIFDDGKKATLRMPDGTTANVEVRDPENRAKIKKGEVKEGDQIEITYERALALSVEKGSKVVSVRKGSFFALAVSICGLACTRGFTPRPPGQPSAVNFGCRESLRRIGGETPRKTLLISLPGRKIPPFRSGNR